MLNISKSLSAHQFEPSYPEFCKHPESVEYPYSIQTRHNSVNYRPLQVHHSPYPRRSRILRLDETPPESFQANQQHSRTRSILKTNSHPSFTTAELMAAARYPLAQSIRDSQAVAIRQPGHSFAYSSGAALETGKQGQQQIESSSAAPLPISSPSPDSPPAYSPYPAVARKTQVPGPSAPAAAERASVASPNSRPSPAPLDGVLYASKAEESGRALLVQVRQTPTGASAATTHSKHSRRSTIQEMELHPHPAVAIVLGALSTLCCMWCCGFPALILGALPLCTRPTRASELKIARVMNRSAVILGAVGVVFGVLAAIVVLLVLLSRLFGLKAHFSALALLPYFRLLVLFKYSGSSSNFTRIGPCFATHDASKDCDSLLASSGDGSVRCCCRAASVSSNSSCVIDNKPENRETCSRLCGY